MITMPTRELVGLLADVVAFASPDDEDTYWHRIVIRWDGERLHASAGDAVRAAHVSWGPDDEDADDDALFDVTRTSDDEPWHLALLPGDVKDIVAKFKLSAKQGAAPLNVDGNMHRLRIQRDGEARIALTSVAEARPWADEHPDVEATVRTIRDDAGRPGNSRATVEYSGAGLSDFANPKVVRQRGSVNLYFGPHSTYVTVGVHFEGALVQGQATPGDLRRPAATCGDLR